MKKMSKIKPKFEGQIVSGKLTLPQAEKDKEKFFARRRLAYAVYSGKLKRLSCAKCGELKVQGHHPDYSKPLEVIWLCGVHHRELHKQYQRKL